MDLIDRKQALKEINERHKEAVEWFLGTTNNDFMKAKAESALASFTECYITILKLPSAEPKKGQWYNPNPPGRSDGIMCSECGYDSIALYNYCPHCGAKMEVSE